MNKLTVTLQDTEADRYKRMFEAACVDLGRINACLGLDPDAGGAEPIIHEFDQILTEQNRLKTELKNANAQTEKFERKWYLACDQIEDQQEVITRREAVIKILEKDLYLATETVHFLRGGQVVMVNLMREALQVIETIETNDPDEESELTRLKGHMGKLIEQSLTSLMGQK